MDWLHLNEETPNKLVVWCLLLLIFTISLFGGWHVYGWVISQINNPSPSRLMFIAVPSALLAFSFIYIVTSINYSKDDFVRKCKRFDVFFAVSYGSLLGSLLQTLRG